ncbi:MAG: pilus assembly protein [Pirellulales bacterium]|nr:pilus assembly protein [Pirellulales bacterium]
MNRLSVPKNVAGRRRSRRRGATTVEFALTAPLLFMMVLGAIEFSRANMLLHTSSIAATEAARASIIPGATVAEVRAAGQQQLNLIGVTEATFTIEPAEILPDTKQVTVNLSVPVNLRNGYLLPRVFLGRSVFKSVTLQREGATAETGSESAPKTGIVGEMQGDGYSGFTTASSAKTNGASNASATGTANANAKNAASSSGS